MKTKKITHKIKKDILNLSPQWYSREWLNYATEVVEDELFYIVEQVTNKKKQKNERVYYALISKENSNYCLSSLVDKREVDNYPNELIELFPGYYIWKQYKSDHNYEKSMEIYGYWFSISRDMKLKSIGI